MKAIQNILVPIDLTDAIRPIMAHAIEIAKRSDAWLHVMHVMNPVEGDSYSPLRYAPEAQMLQDSPDASVYRLLTDAMAPFDTEGLKIELVKKRSTAITTSILDYATKQGVDLIVMGTHGRKGVTRLLVGSVAQEVLRHALCAVMTVGEASAAVGTALRRILVPLDFSRYATVLLHRALDLAALYNAQLDLLHVIEPFAFPVSLTGIRTIYDVVPDIKEKVRAKMENLLKDSVGLATKVNIHVADGHAAAAITAFAEEHDVDLIVLSTKGLTGVERFFVGSVAERVVRAAPCPVFAVQAGTTNVIMGDEGEALVMEALEEA